MRAAQSLVCIHLFIHVDKLATRARTLFQFRCFVPAVSLQTHPVSAPTDKYREEVPDSAFVPLQSAPKAMQPKVLQGTIPSGHIPKPVILPDYIA